MKDQKTIYVHQTVTLWSENGEVYIETDTGTVLVFNATSLFEDIPHLFSPADRDWETKIVF
jgi:hypothetical protein